MSAPVDVDTVTLVELQLVDVVIRHELGPVPVAAEDLGAARARRWWSTITAIWQSGATPSMRNVHDQLCIVRSHPDAACDAATIMFLPTGRLALVDDYVTLITTAGRRRRVATLLAEASTAILDGSDPDAVLSSIIERVA